MPYTLLEQRPSFLGSHFGHHGRGGAGNTHNVDNPFRMPASASASASISASTIHSGVGTAATRTNTVTSASTSTSTSPNPSSSSSSSSSHPFKISTGRGGAGNHFPASERAMFSFDEELEVRRARETRAAPVYHVGRGGAGNVEDGRWPGLRGSAGNASSAASMYSARSGADNAWARVNQTFGRV